jgi:ketosteroid isomerase-like protein
MSREESAISKRNVEVVRAIYEAWAQHGLEAGLRYLEPGVVWDVSRRLVDPGVYRGHEGVRDYVRGIRKAYSGMGSEHEDLLEAGDKVVALLTFRAEGRSSGAAVQTRIANVWTLRDEKVVRMEYFGDREEALAAAGVRGANSRATG